MTQRILIVDDDRSIVNVLRAYLDQAGYQVLTAYDGDAALQSLRRERPDLAVLDLMMPGRDGWEITRIVRANQSLAALPIILLTARVEDTDKILGLELGADDYVTKPFNAREVVARVSALLHRPAGRSRLPRATEPARSAWRCGTPARAWHPSRSRACSTGSTVPTGRVAGRLAAAAWAWRS